MATKLSIVISASAMIGGAMSAIRTLTGGLDSVRRSSNILGNEQRRLRSEIDRLGTSSAVPALQRQYERLGSTMRDLRMNSVHQAGIQPRLENSRQARADMQGEVMGLVGAGLTLAAPVKLAIDFESSMADVKKVVDFDTPQQFKQMQDDILRLTHTIPMAGTEIAQIVAAGGQSGVARENLLGFATNAAKMGVAFDMAAGDAGKAMATLSNVLKIPIENIDRLGDAINHLSDNANSNAADIVNVLTRVGGTARQLKLTENQAAALGSTFLSMGKPPELAAQAMEGMLSTMAMMKTGKYDDDLARLGYKTGEFARAMNEDAQGAITQFLQKIKELPEDDQYPFLTKLFGSNYNDDVQLLANSVGEYGRQLDLLNEKDPSGNLSYLGSMSREFDNQAATTANHIKTLKNQMVDLGVKVGSVVLPALNGLINDLKPVIEKIIAFAKANPVLISALFKVVATLFAFKVGSLAVRFGLNLLFGGFLSVYGSLLKVSGAFKIVNASISLFKMGRAVSALRLFGLSARQARTAIKLFTGGFGFIKAAFSGISGFVLKAGAMIGKALMGIVRVAMVAGKAMLANPIVLAGVLIAGVAYLIWRNWDTIKPKLVEFWTAITQAANGAWQWLVGIWNGFTAWFSGLWNGITAWVSGVWTGIVNGASIAWQWLVGIWNGFTAWFASLWTSITTWVSGVWTGIVNAASAAWAWLVGIWSGFVAWFGGLWTGITTWVSGVWTGIVNGASAAWAWLVGIWGGAVAWFSGLWTSVQAVAVGVWTGITGFLGGIWATIRALVSAGIQGLMAIIRSFSPVSAFSTAFSAVWGFLSGLVGRFRSFGVNIIQGLIGGIKSMAGAVTSAISSVVGKVPARAKSMLKINSPSRLFHQFGAWVSEGLALGIDKGGQKPVSAIGSVASGVTANFGAKMGNLSAQISTSVGEHQARMAKANATNSQSQGNITIHFNPTINAGGNDIGKIERALQLSQAEFEKMFNRMQQDKLRRAY